MGSVYRAELTAWGDLNCEITGNFVRTYACGVWSLLTSPLLSSILSSILTSLLLVFIVVFGTAIGSICFFLSTALSLNLVEVYYDHFGRDSSSLETEESLNNCFGVLKLAVGIAPDNWLLTNSDFTLLKDSCKDVLPSFFYADVYDAFESVGALSRFSMSINSLFGFSKFDFFKVGSREFDFGLFAV